MAQEEKNSIFAIKIVPHLDAAYNLARGLARNEQDAEDIVQDAFIRAYSYLDSFSGKDGKTWLLAIVRNTFYSWRERKQVRQKVEVSDRTLDDLFISDSSRTPEAVFESKDTQEEVHKALNSLPVEFRETLILWEIESMSYKEIASITGVPMGTVMSRLARGREMLRTLLNNRWKGNV
ncbi:MAG: sigma-70 family RNA polymerase sigma factor [Bacteroidota bacterium]|nr:sigma-70 family RNA polymerase sigma factor [Bacteroidota bacterium]